MKFLIIGFLFLTTYVFSTESATVEELRRRAEQLLEIASNEIRILKEEGKALSAEGLEREETILLELVVELRAASSEGEEVERLEERLNAFEQRFGEELRILGREFVTDREKEEIIRRAQELLNTVSAEIILLKEQNKSLLAEGLEQQEVNLVQLVIDLRAAQNAQAIRSAEAMLRSLERVVFEELRRLGRTLKKRDVKDDLITRAKELLKTATEQVQELKLKNRTQAAELIGREEGNITAIIQELEKATAEPEIRQLEQRLGQQEDRLFQDLLRLGQPIGAQELKDMLLKSAQDLTEIVNEEIKNLKQANRTQEAELGEHEVQAIAELVAQLKNATQVSDLKQIEEQLGLAEFRLWELAQRLGITGRIDPQEIQALIRRAEELAVRATIEIRKLREQQKGLLAEGLEREEQYLIELDVELRAATTPEQVQRLEQRLRESEQRVSSELSQLGRTLKKRDLKDDLIKRAEELEKTANEGVKTLRQQNRTNAAELIEREELQIQRIVQELKNTTQETEVRSLEERLRESENRLTEDLRRIGSPIDPLETRDNLIKLAERSIAFANQEVKTLEAEGNTQGVEALQREEKQIQELLVELKNATQESDIRSLEGKLVLAEFRLGEELRLLGRQFVNPERDALVRRAEEIAVRATIEIRKLREAGRGLLAAGLEREERYLVELDVELRTATTPEQLRSIEERLAAAEQRVNLELRQLARTFSVIDDSY